MTRINSGIPTTGFSSLTVDDAKTNIPSAPKTGNAQDKSLSVAGKIPKGSPPPMIRGMLVKKSGQSSVDKPAADASPTATCTARKPRSRGTHHPSLKKFFDSIPPGIAENAMLSAGAIASTFGLGAAANNIARASGNPAVKVAGAMFPISAGIASAYVEKAIRQTFDVKSTELQHLWHSAISPASLMAANYAYTLSTLPKFPPNTPAGVATTLAVSALGAGIGGGLTEAAAQWSKKNASSSIPATSDPGNKPKPTTFEQGIGRALTQIPAAYLNKVIATHAAGTGGTAPRNLLLGIPAAISVPYTFRNEVASRIANSAKPRSSGQASNTDAPRASGN